MILLDDRSIEKLREIVRWYEATNGKLMPLPKPDELSNTIVPFELTAEPSNASGQWTAKGKQIYWNENTGYAVNDDINDTEADVYFPTARKPDYTISDRIFCIYRGRWEQIGGGGTVVSTIFGIIKSEFTSPPDATPSDPSDSDFKAACGTVQVIGKTYTETDGEWNYDLVSCFMLADTEYLVEGSLFELTKSQYIDENGDLQDWYIVVNPPADYAVTLNGTIIAGQQGTFNIGSHTVDVYGNLIPAGYRCADEVNGYPQDYIVERKHYGDTYRLYVTGGTCPRIIST